MYCHAEIYVLGRRGVFEDDNGGTRIYFTKKIVVEHDNQSERSSLW